MPRHRLVVAGLAVVAVAAFASGVRYAGRIDASRTAEVSAALVGAVAGAAFVT